MSREWKEGARARVSKEAMSYVKHIAGYSLMTPLQREEHARTFDRKILKRGIVITSIPGPRNRFVPRAKFGSKNGAMFASEYEALVRARLSNPKLALAGKRTIDRVTIIGAGGHESDKDLWRDYKPQPRPGELKMPYALVTSRQWPETRFEYAFATLEETEAMAAADPRLKNVREWTIVGGQSNKLLARFQGPELEHLFRSLKPNDLLPEKISYNDLLNRVAHAIEYCKVDPCPPKTLEDYRRKQQLTAGSSSKPSKPVVAATKSEEIEMETQTETGASKASKKKSAGKPAAGAKKSAKGKTPAQTKGKGGKALKTANKAVGAKAPKAASGRDPLGREGTAARFMSDGIMAGKSNEKIAAELAKHKDHKSAKSIEAKHVAWQRFNLKRKGVKAVPDSE
jgi:hypothetical protein